MKPGFCVSGDSIRLSGVIDVVEYDPAWPDRFEQLRREYAAVKRRLGATAATRDEYTGGKNEIVLRILAAAGLDEADQADIAAGQLPTFGP